MGEEVERGEPGCRTPGLLKLFNLEQFPSLSSVLLFLSLFVDMFEIFFLKKCVC